MRWRRGLVAWVVAAALAACGGSNGGGTDEPTTPSETQTTAPPAGGAGGVAHVEIEGGPTYDAPFVGPEDENGFPPDDVALYWATPDATGDLTLRFPTGVGTRPTSVSPKVELVIVAGDGIVLQSNGGECQITVDTAEPTEVAGSFECSFPGDHERVTGTFEARAG